MLLISVDYIYSARFVNNETNTLYKEGELLVRKDLAETFRRLQNANNIDIFYNGGMTNDLVKEIQAANGIITAQDFNIYKVRERTAIKMNLRDNITLYSIEPPGSGALLGFMMNVMGQYNDLYPNASETLEKSVLFHHRLIETWKFAYAHRMHLGDVDFDKNSTRIVEKLMNETYAEEIRKMIDDKKTQHDPNYYYNYATFGSFDAGTAHVSVIDSYGNAVAITDTINHYFGSKVMSPSTGIIFNNQMDGFSSPNVTNSYGVPPSDFNLIVPGKRPLSSMCPAIFVDTNTGQVRLVIGGAGGPKITSAVASVAIRHLWMKETIKTAIDAPRLHHQLFPDRVVYEDNFPKNVRDALSKLGHNVTVLRGRGAVIMGISEDKDGKLYANSDWRKVGDVDGYDEISLT